MGIFDSIFSGGGDDHAGSGGKTSDPGQEPSPEVSLTDDRTDRDEDGTMDHEDGAVSPLFVQAEDGGFDAGA